MPRGSKASPQWSPSARSLPPPPPSLFELLLLLHLLLLLLLTSETPIWQYSAMRMCGSTAASGTRGMGINRGDAGVEDASFTLESRPEEQGTR